MQQVDGVISADSRSHEEKAQHSQVGQDSLIECEYVRMHSNLQQLYSMHPAPLLSNG